VGERTDKKFKEKKQAARFNYIAIPSNGNGSLPDSVFVAIGEMAFARAMFQYFLLLVAVATTSLESQGLPDLPLIY
jgi:hypothetical protein